MGKATLFGLHIPKCAGTSLLAAVRKHLSKDQIFQSTSLIENWRTGRPDFLEIKDYSKLVFVWGHWLHEEMLKFFDKPVLFTGLRDPRDRIESEYFFDRRLRLAQGRKILSPEEWLRNRRDPMCQFIVSRFPTLSGKGTLFERARSVLECFNFVYFTNDLSGPARLILNHIGVDFEGVPGENVRPDICERIYVEEGQIENDMLLYRWAKETFDCLSGIEESINNSRLESFLEGPLNIERLAEFHAKAAVEEYRNFNVLAAARERISVKTAYYIALNTELGR